MTTMRAKLVVASVESHENTDGETLRFNAVAKADGYPEDGSDENNSFARWTPQADLTMYVCNPDLLGKFKQGDEFYVDFTRAE